MNFLKFLRIKKGPVSRSVPDGVLSELADGFGVSRDVIAIRLENLDFAPFAFS